MTRIRFGVGLGFAAALACGAMLRFSQGSRVDPPVGRGTEPAAFCFAPGTDPEVMAHYNQVMQTDPTGARYQLAGRWSGAQGSPRALTWSFVPDGLSMEGSTSDLFARMDALFAAQGGRAVWIARIQECFDRWAQLSGTSYTRITSGGNDWDDGASWGSGGSAGHGDVRIGMVPIDGMNSVLAYNYYPSNGDMVLDSAEAWGRTANANRFLRNIVMHEHGHGIGLAHICTDTNQLMEPFLNTLFDGPRDDDVRGAQRHYGDDDEPNDTAAAATLLGSVEVGLPITLGAPPAPAIGTASLLSLDADGENDYFRFSVAGERTATLAITPVGRVYDNSPQNGDGSCGSGNNINSLTMANLNVQLLGPNGSTVLAAAAVQPAGAAESISNVGLIAGNYYARVYEEGAPTQAQFYQLSISVNYLDCNINGLGDPCELSCGSPGGPCDVPGCGQGADCNANGTLDDCDSSSPDCNANAVPDECELAGADCNANAIPDDCEIAGQDCNTNGALDACDLSGGASLDANGNSTPDECETAPFAVVTAALSRWTCDLPLALAPGLSTEPRQDGIGQLRIAFNVPPAALGGSPVSIEERQCPAPGAYGAYSGAAVPTAGVAGNELLLDFVPVLENLRTYRITFGPSVTSAAGQFIEVRGLIADVNSDGAVNALDRSVVVGAWTGAGFSCATDINADGSTDALDRSIAVGAWTGAQNCSP